jgi:hypothetical protein
MSYDTEEYLAQQFAARVLEELHARGMAVDRRQFAEFMEAMGPLVMPEEDSPAWWADAYLEATTGEARAPRVVVV